MAMRTHTRNNEFNSLNHQCCKDQENSTAVESTPNNPLKPGFFTWQKLGLNLLKVLQFFPEKIAFCQSSKGAVVSLWARHHAGTSALRNVMKLKVANVPPLAAWVLGELLPVVVKVFIFPIGQKQHTKGQSH